MPTPSGYVLVSDAFAKRMANAIMDKTRLSSSITGEAFPSALSTIVTTKDFFNENVIEITDEINYSYTIKGDTNVLDFISRDTLQPFAFQWIYDLTFKFDTNYQWSRYTVNTGPYSEFYSAMYYSISGLSNLKEINVDSFKIIHTEYDYEGDYTYKYYGYIAQSEYTELLPNLHRINDSYDYNNRKDSMYEDVWDGEYGLFDNILGIYPYGIDYHLSIPNCSYIGSGAFAAMNMSDCAQSILTAYSSYSTVINDILFTKAVLPSELDLTGYTKIGSGAFAGCFSDVADYASITSPNISYIGNHAFWQCNMLSYISPMPNCSYIGKGAFFNCINLFSISIPNVEYIGDYAFNYCFGENGSEPTTIVLSIPNCSYIGDSAFNNGIRLSYIYAPNCTYLGSYAFANCYNLTIDLDFNNNTSISYLGDYCTGSITIYGEEATFYSNNLIVPNQVNCGMLTYIGSNAFLYCHNLSSISLPNVEYIGESAFAYCSNLSSISIPNCGYIGGGAFAYCSNLSYISLPNVEYIGESAFAYCSSLTNSCVQEILDNYKSYSTVLNGGVFKNCISITSLDLTGYTSINSAFYSCYNLSYVSLPNCSYIGYYAFGFCSSLYSISLPNCSYIGSNAFWSCSSLSYISIPNCSYISGFAFQYCSNLSYISLPNCSYIGNNAFYSCTKLESIYVLSTSIPILYNINAFISTPLSQSSYLGYFGSIYVLSSLVDSFKTATNWSYYSSRIVAYTN